MTKCYTEKLKIQLMRFILENGKISLEFVIKGHIYAIVNLIIIFIFESFKTNPSAIRGVNPKNKLIIN